MNNNGRKLASNSHPFWLLFSVWFRFIFPHTSDIRIASLNVNDVLFAQETHSDETNAVGLAKEFGGLSHKLHVVEALPSYLLGVLPLVLL